jgi:sigma-B regulation protein RsbU (phosphoserine phosphatase)
MKESPLVLLVGTPLACTQDLRAEGFQVELAADLAGGIALARNGIFGLVVLDLELPGCQGLDALCRFYQAVPGVPLLVLAGPEKLGIVTEAIAHGAQDCLFKDNLTAVVLVQAVRSAIARSAFQKSRSDDRMLLHALMEHIPDAIYFKDRASRFLMISAAHAGKFHSGNPATVIGKTDHDFFTTSHADQAREDELKIMRTGQPLVGVEELETWPDGSETWVSTTKMPLRDAGGRIVGTFGISRDITERKRMQDALALRTRQLEQKNEQIAEELKMARELQMAMLPQEFPTFLNGGKASAGSALEFFSFYHPTGAVSGDFFTVTALSDSKVGVFICDVMGHDVRAALVTAMLRSQVQDLGATTPEPGALLAQINQNLFGVFKQTGATMYATAFYLVADVARGEIHYASAAHPEPLQVRRSAGLVEPLNGDTTGRAKGPALGLFGDSHFSTHRRKLEAGDLIALYTDGLIEINSADEQQIFTPELLAAAVRQQAQLPATELLEGVISHIKKFSGQPDFEDDVCLIGIEVKRLGQPAGKTAPAPPAKVV